ncbi:excisionase family DNA-binding protein, partial [Streptomyces sp. tea 10]|nr:excisionase family DNA-binding protein [Streptomyces sp. tea 10]
TNLSRCCWVGMNAEQRTVDVESVQSAASRLGICPRTVRRMIADGRLPSYRVGSLTRFFGH